MQLASRVIYFEDDQGRVWSGIITQSDGAVASILWDGSRDMFYVFKDDAFFWKRAVVQCSL